MDSPGCHTKIQQGKRKGQSCGRRPKKGERKCHYHFKVSKVEGSDKGDRGEKNEKTEKVGEKVGFNLKVIKVIKKTTTTGMKRNSERCAICLDDISEKSEGYVKLMCSHQFHNACVIRINNRKCPICRKVIRGVNPLIKIALEQNCKKENKIKELESALYAMGLRVEEIHSHIVPIPIGFIDNGPNPNVQNFFNTMFNIMQERQEENNTGNR